MAWEFMKLINSQRAFDEDLPKHIAPTDQLIMIKNLKTEYVLELVNLEITYGIRVKSRIEPLTVQAKNYQER